MKLKRIFKTLCLLAYFISSGACYAQQSNDFFSKFPKTTVFSILEPVSGFTPIVCEASEKTNDTIWVKKMTQPPMWKIQAGMDDENIVVISQSKDGKRAYMKNILYPKDAIKKGKEGKVEATCIVEEDGSLTDIRIVRSVFSSIDAEAVRLFSGIKLLPGKIGEKNLRCRHKVALLFEIIDKKNGYGRALVVNANKLSEGVAKEYKHDVRWTETTTQTKKDEYGFENSKSWTSGRWHTSLDIDVPKNNLDFEKILCKVLYNKGGKSIEQAGPKFAKKFQGKLKNGDFKNIKGNDLSIVARCLSYKADKYYSYGYETKLDRYSVTHNFIYDIQAKRLLTISDILTEECIKTTGLNTEEVYDLGMNEYFLYVGKTGKSLVVIDIAQENWNKFSPMFQALLGDKQSYPIKINRNAHLEKTKFGIQPKGIVQRVLNKPSLVEDKDGLYYYINKNLVRPKGITEKPIKVNLSFVVEKDGTLSNIEITQTGEGAELRNELMHIIKGIPKLQPLTFSKSGAVRFYQTLKYNITFSNKMTGSSRNR